jgi:hypothetical protein
MIAAKQVLSNRQAKAVLQTETLRPLYPRHGRMLPVLHFHPELRPSGLIGERGRGASTLTSQGRNPHALQDASGRRGLLNFSVCSNELLWESLAQNRCIIDAFL